MHRPTSALPALLISSVSCGGEPDLCFEEVSTDFFHCVDVGLLEKAIQGGGDVCEHPLQLKRHFED